MPVDKITTALEGAKAAGIDNIVALRGGASPALPWHALPCCAVLCRAVPRALLPCCASALPTLTLTSPHHILPLTHPPTPAADPPKGAETWTATEGGFSCALDLVKHIRANYGDHFCVSVAGYPEGHPGVIKKVEPGQALTASERRRVITLEDGDHVCSDADYAGELAYLKAKCDAGADVIITQMFFDVEVFLQFVRDCRSLGIGVPIMPGLMLIQNYGGFKRMTAFCKSRVPAFLAAQMEAVKDEDAKVREAGVAIGAAMCKALIAAGVKGLHLYTLNTEAVPYGVLKELGLFVDFPEGTKLD